MDGNHPKNTDPRPKRAKDKDNPYTIFTVGIHSDHPHYYVQFSDASGVERCVEVDREVFALMDGCELEDKSYLNEVDRHYEHSEQTEETLHERSVLHAESVEDIAILNLQKEELHKAIAELPEVQRRRLVLYYFGRLTYEQIAEMEGCTKMAVKFSVDNAISKLKEKI